MDETRLKRIGEDLERARTRRDEWERKVKELERKYKEAENTCIHEMVHAASITPEQLAKLLQLANSVLPGTLTTENVNPAENVSEMNDQYEEDQQE